MRKFNNALLLSLTAVFCLFSTAFALAQTTLSSTSLNFGNVAVNTTSAIQYVRVTNNQTTALTITSLVPSSGYALDPTTSCPSSGTIAAGHYCVLSIVFEPVTVSLNPQPGSLTINFDNGSSQAVSLSGTGIADATLSATSLNFGNVAVNTTSAIQYVRVTNNQTTALGITSLVPSGSYALDPTTSCPSSGTITAGHYCVLSIVFEPVTVSPNPQPGSLTINFANGNSQAVSLSGLGYGPLALPPSGALPGATTNIGYSSAINATGGNGTNYTFRVNGTAVQTNGTPLAIANGITVSSNGSYTLSIGGTPTLSQMITLNVSVRDSVGDTAGPNAYTITTTPPTPLTLPTPDSVSLPAGNTTQPYSAAISASGGSGMDYVYSVNGTQIPINSAPAAPANADGLTFTNNGGTLFINGTPGAAGAFTLNVSVTDSATDSTGPVAYTLNVINPYLGYKVSGNVYYTGSQTGWIYIKLSSSNCGSCGGSGTAIPAMGPFTINGVQAGTYQLQAFMDNIGYGAENASNPTGSVSSVVVTDGAVNNVNVTLTDPSAITLGSNSPTISQASGFSGGAFVSLNGLLQNNKGDETATSYNVRWSTDSTFDSVLGSTSFPATGGQNPWIVSGVTGCATCYFEVQGVAGAGASTTNWSGPFGPVTIGAPTGGNTVTGTVTLPSAVTPTGPLYVGFYDQNSGNIYVTVIASPSSSTPNNYMVQVPTGSNYYFFGVLDQNNNGLMNAAGNISNTNENNNTPVVIDPSNSSTLTQNLTLPTTGTVPTNSIARITTQHNQQIGSTGTSDSYKVDLRVTGLYKLPVAVQLTAAPSPGAVNPADYATGAFNGDVDEFDNQPNLNGSTPKAGDSYNLLVTYSDNTSEPLAVTIPSGGVLNAFATLISPASQATGVSTTPNFSWTDPANSSNYVYQFQLQDTNNNTIWQIPGGNHNKSNGFSNSITSLTWGVDPTGSGNVPSVTSLNNGTVYQWSIQATDANNNEATIQQSFQTAEPALTLPASGALPPAVVGRSYSSGAVTGTATYTYHGNGFYPFISSGPYTASNAISGYFTTSSNLALNLNAVDISSEVTSYSFTDGSVNTFTPSNSAGSRFVVSTNSQGAITAWFIILGTGTPPTNSALWTCNSNNTRAMCGLNYPEDLSYENNGAISGSVPSDPGTWTYSLIPGSSVNITTSGGSGSGYSFTVNGQTVPTDGSTLLLTNGDGLSAIQTGANTLTISGTPTAVQLVSLAISVQDGVGDTAGPVTYTIDIFNEGSGTTATGNVSYGGTQTGWVYLSLVPTNNCNSNGCKNPNPGTAISAATLASGGAFTIHGVQPGNYNLNAWMDTLGYGVENVVDPSGSTSVTVTGSTLSGASVTMYDPGTVTLSSAPTWNANLGVGAFSGGAMVYFSSILNSSGVQVPTSYILQYSTDSTFNTGVSSMSFPAAHADHHWIVNGLTNGATYYFRAAGVMGSGNSAVTGPWSAPSPTGGLTIGAPTGPNTIQGTVTFTGTATGPLYVGLIDVGLGNNNIFADVIQNPVSPQAYSIQVPSGSEFVLFGIIDQNNDGWNGPGDISNFGGNGPPSVYVNGSMSGVNLTLPSSNSVVVLDTEHWSVADEYNTGGGYNLLTVVSAAGKLPVAAELLSGPNVIAPEDVAVCGTCSLIDRLYSMFTPGSTPTVGDPYKFQVTYSDGSSETLNLAVTGVAPLLTNLAPSGIGGTSTTPTFTWTYPANASNYDYQFLLYDQNGNTLWEVPYNFTGLSGFPSSITSIPWGADPTGANNPPSISSLTSGEAYYWQVGATDVYGNWSQTYVDYVPGYAPLYLPTPNPPTLGSATLGKPYSGMITVVGGYSPYSWSVNGCHWNCNVSIGKGLTASYTGFGNNTLTVSGTPNATGSVSFTAYVYDSTGITPTTTYTYTINITQTPVTLNEPSAETAFIGQPFSETISASGGTGSGYSFWVGVNGATSSIVPTSPSVLQLTDNLSATINSNDQLIISGTPTTAASISLAIHVSDNQGNNTSQPESLNVAAAPSGANNGNLYGTYVCKVDGFVDANGARGASLASFYADGNGNLSNGVWDMNSRDQAGYGAAAGTMSGTYSIDPNNNGLASTTSIQTSGGSGTNSNTYAIALSNAGEPASPAQEFRMVEIDDVGINAIGYHSTADCYLASTGAFKASTIGSNSFAFGLQGEDDSGNPKAYVGRFTAVAGSPGGTISTGIFDGMAVNQSGDQGASITSGTYTAPNANTGRFTFAFTAGGYTSNFTGYIIDANRMFLLSTDAASDIGIGDNNGIMSGDMRTQQQGSYSGTNLNNNMAIYWQGYGYQNGSIAGYGSTVLQGNGDGAGNFTINQSYDDQNGTYKVGNEVGGPISVTFDSSNQGRTYFSPGGGMIYMYFFNNNNAFFLMLNGGNPSSLDTGWVEPQTQTTFTNAALAGDYLMGQLPMMQSSANGTEREWDFDNAGHVTGDTSSGGQGAFNYDAPVATTTYAWLSTTYGTFSVTTGATGRSCAVINSTRAACIANTNTPPSVMILQQ